MIFLKRLGFFVVLLVATLVVIYLRYTFRDYESMFLQQKGMLLSFDTREIGRSVYTRTEDVELRSSTGLTVRAWLRIPVRREGPYPAALVASGIETGHLVIKMLDERPTVIAMAIRYPHEGDADFSGWNALRALLDMRTAGMRTIPSLLLALDFLRQHPRVDTSDIAVATVSFGTFVGVPAATLHPGVKRLIIVQGGGNIAAIIAANAERLDMPLSEKLSGFVGHLLLSPFEPNRYIKALSPRPLLMVNSPGDLLFPDQSALALFDRAGEPKEIVWHKTTHVMPGALQIIEELTEIVVERAYARYYPRE